MATNDKPATRSRRQFLHAAAATTAAAPYIIPASVLGRDGKPAPSERISLGIIGTNGMGHAPVQNAPSDLDWQRWLGPARDIPYNSLLAANSYNHCSFWDYSGGWVPGMAPHIIDLPIWAWSWGCRR